MKKPKQKRKRSNAMKKAAPTQADGAPPAASRRKFVIAGLAAAAALAGAGALAYVAVTAYIGSRSEDQSSTMPAATGGSQYFEQAKVQIFKEERDLGTMRVSEDRSAEFFLRNVGGKPLEISQVRTSCMCTFAQVIIDDEKSPLFNMEMSNPPAVQSWKGVVEPSLTATVRVVYRPSLMPVEGSVQRNVMFNTNDPSRPVIELGIHANVQ